MQNILIIVLTSLIFIILIGITFILKRLLANNKVDNNQDEQLFLLGEMLKSLKHDLAMEIKETRKELDHKIYTGQKDMNEGLKYQSESSHKLIGEIFEHLNKVNQSVIEVKEGSKQVISMTEQLSNLEKVLNNQKQRGTWGEQSLELILSNSLPFNTYESQYKYKNGYIVDIMIKMKDKFLPIDSKFSIENYIRAVDADLEEDRKAYVEDFKKDIKNRIEETAKYVNESEENTVPFAFMFIPSESIYYDLNSGLGGRLKIDSQKLFDHARDKKVIIVSPTSILAYLFLVSSGVKAFNIEENAKLIQKKVEDLSKHLLSFEEYYSKIGNSINTVVNHYNTGNKELKKIDKDMYAITEGNSLRLSDHGLLEKTNIES